MMVYISASAQQPVTIINDKMAISKSGQNQMINLFKQQEYQKILESSEDILSSYTNIEVLQQKVLIDLKQAETVKDLHWTDLSKLVYLANELVKGVVQPGIEHDYVIEHPLFEQHSDEIYQDIFIAGAGNQLPTDLNSFLVSKQKSQSLSTSFQQFAAQRKTYAAVAFQYLSEDLMVKAIEMNEILKQPARFSMTEAERIQLQSYAEKYLELAAEMLEKSDKLLLEMAYCRSLQTQSDQLLKTLERETISRTTVLDY